MTSSINSRNVTKLAFSKPALIGSDQLRFDATAFYGIVRYVCQGTADLFWPQAFGRGSECTNPDYVGEDAPASYRLTSSSGCQAYLCEHCVASISVEASFVTEVVSWLQFHWPDLHTLLPNCPDVLQIHEKGVSSFATSWESAEKLLYDMAAGHTPEAYRGFRQLQVTARELGIWPEQPFADKVRVEGVKAADPAHATLLYGTDSAEESFAKAIGRGLWNVQVLEDAWPEFRELREWARKSHLHHGGVPERVRELQEIVLPKLAVLKALYGSEEGDDE